MPPVSLSLLGTGGTIDKDYPRAAMGYAFEIDEPAAERVLTALPLSFTFDTTSVLKKDSQEITDGDRTRLAKALRKTAPNRVIITHGTDTLIETARYLVQSGSVGDKVVALTGAKKPEAFKDSDAAFNIGVAVGATATLPPGSVVVCMSGRVIDAMKCTRDAVTGYFVEEQLGRAAAASGQAINKKRRRPAR